MPSQGGTVTATVTSVRDPLPIGRPDPGCRLVGLGFRLQAGGSAAGVDLFSRMRVVAESGDAYEPHPESVEGRDGIESTDLMPGDERRGTVVFQVPATQRLRYFSVGGNALTTDLTAPGPPVSLPPYRPGDWPRLGTTQQALRQAGERLDVTPQRVMDPAPASGGVAAGRRAYSVQLSLRVAGTRPWPLNPEHMVVFLDSEGRQWFPGFVTTTAAPGFENLRTDPGQRQTAWVTAEIPKDARIVAMSLSPYAGIVYAWRL
ncbi:hypothetical protein [Paractinoplanes globisporus]|uniref:Uncharacterized protein n=1 Tax=Paractinoplanes globisporus TaxID=113565 RepID=A0ABW6WAI8_9ACTN|nr:hypothetical protein [Actinoplanes globisporus]